MDFLSAISFTIHSVTNFFGICANIILIYVVIKRTPSTMTTYSMLILNFAITDLLSCIASITVQQRILPGGLGLFYLSYGPCRYFGPLACLIAYSFMLHCYAHWFFSLVYSFCYRYYILCNDPPRRSRVLLVILLIYIPSFVQFLA
ncbi:unnamed protein product [Strongylus vulgaris]|uniref:G-protein coupled receptors family 1 profile domain-containing protein n=1 Tax=Strongylus vulgaris TaxID=40348 RepID=A0A3P7J2I9_STRVU|nr:unnamed protein product [Strongylus vulgaris]